MTPDEIRNLRPGPELDRAVAMYLLDRQIYSARIGIEYIRGAGDSLARIPAYSTTWPGLGLVVDEMERRGWYMGGGREIVPPDFPGQRMIGFGKPPGDPGELLGQAVSATTYMEAACKAALLALAAEEGQKA